MLLSRRETLLTDKNSECLFGSVSVIDRDSSLAALIRAIIIRGDAAVTPSFVEERSYIDQETFDASGDYFSSAYDDDKILIVKYTTKKPEVASQNWQHSANNMYIKATEIFMSKYSETYIYQNPKEQRVVLFVRGDVSREWAQALESAMFRVLPWYFPKELSTEEKDFFKALVPSSEECDETAKRKLICFCDEAAALYDLRKRRIKILLDNYSRFIAEKQIANKRAELDDIAYALSCLQEEMNQKYKAYDTLTAEINALNNIDIADDTAVSDFFAKHKNLNLISMDGENIRYSVTDTLDYYSVEEAQKLLANERGWFLREFGQEFASLMYKLFVERRGIINISSVFTLSCLRYVSPLKGAWLDTQTMPNPHLYNFGCNGGNDKYYRDYAESGDWDLAIEQSISATKNWNIGDSTVGNKMFRWIQSSGDIKYIWYKDGSPMDDIEDATLISLDEFKLHMIERGEING